MAKSQDKEIQGGHAPFVPCGYPKCRNTVESAIKKGNKEGKRLYCSIDCYHRFSPRKKELVLRWFPNAKREEMVDRFVEIFMYISGQFRDIVDRVAALGISKSAYKYWQNEVEKEIAERKKAGDSIQFSILL